MLHQAKMNFRKLSSGDIKRIKGGLDVYAIGCQVNAACVYNAGPRLYSGVCESNALGECVCNVGAFSIVSSECNPGQYNPNQLGFGGSD
jgi:hypothetical protein